MGGGEGEGGGELMVVVEDGMYEMVGMEMEMRMGMRTGMSEDEERDGKRREEKRNESLEYFDVTLAIHVEYFLKIFVICSLRRKERRRKREEKGSASIFFPPMSHTFKVVSFLQF